MTFLHTCAHCGLEMNVNSERYGQTICFTVEPCRCAKNEKEEKARTCACGEVKMGDPTKTQKVFVTTDHLDDKLCRVWELFAQWATKNDELRRLVESLRQDVIRLENITDPHLDSHVQLTEWVRSEMIKQDASFSVRFAKVHEVAGGIDKIWEAIEELRLAEERNRIEFTKHGERQDWAQGKLTQHERDLAEALRGIRHLQRLHEAMLRPVEEGS